MKKKFHILNIIKQKELKLFLNILVLQVKKSTKDKYETKTDPYDSFIRQIEDINIELDKLEQDREDILSPEDYQKSINNTVKFLQDRQKLYEDYNKKITYR